MRDSRSDLSPTSTRTTSAACLKRDLWLDPAHAAQRAPLYRSRLHGRQARPFVLNITEDQVARQIVPLDRGTSSPRSYTGERLTSKYGLRRAARAPRVSIFNFDV